MKILVVDDEVLIRDVIKEYCEYDGFKVFEAQNGLEAINMVKDMDFDVIIMDIMMPKMDGYQACKEINKLKHIPIIMLSARSEEYDKLYGFDLGIDDYITKPFSPKELIARIKAVTKRKKESPVFKYGSLLIDYAAHEVKIDNKKIELTPKEFLLLKHLTENVNIALSREQLLQSVWGYDFFGDDRTVDTHIKTLRSRLGKERGRIVTVRGMGYKFEKNEK